MVPVFLKIYIFSGSRIEINTNEYAPSSLEVARLIANESEFPLSRYSPIRRATISVSVPDLGLRPSFSSSSVFNSW